MLEKTRKALSDNLSALLKRYPDVSRLDLSRRMNVADGTLGRIKYGTGNPQLDNIVQIAEFFRLEPWQLLIENGHQLPRDFDPFKAPRPVVPGGHVRIEVLDVAPSAGPGGEPEDHPMVLGHIDVADEWARSRLGRRLEHIRALPVNGDSMSPTINEGDLVFVDTSCRHFDAEGIYVLLFDRALLLKRLSADHATKRIQLVSDNTNHKTQLVSQDDITICGRVKAWLTLRGA